jgi:FAD:protein FMN transferase
MRTNTYFIFWRLTLFRFFTLFRFLTLLTFLFASSALVSCSKTLELQTIEGFAQGTTYHITFVAHNHAEQPQLKQEITQELNRLDLAISNYRDDSAIERFNAQLSTEPQATTAEIIHLIALARGINKASNGCYDLTIKPLFDLWGFKKEIFNLPSPEVLQQTLTLIGMDKVETLNATHLRKTLPSLRVDLSSIGQGYSVEKIANILEQHHIEDYIVEIGGELKTRGKKMDRKAWRVALEKPLPNERKLDKIIAFNSGEPVALMTSGTYRHYFDNNGKRYSHILDARSGKPIEHNTVSVTVLHPNPTLADAWSTALLCLGSKAGLDVANAQGIAALYIDQEGETLLEEKSLPLQKLTGITFETPP